MSRTIERAELYYNLGPELRVSFLAKSFLNEGRVDPIAKLKLVSKVNQLGLKFTPDELDIFSALNTPSKVQDFLDNGLYYNFDHATLLHSQADSEESAMPPRLALRHGKAHCFEGTLLAYMLNFLHGNNPKWVLLEASLDIEHNLVVGQDPASGLWWANAHSSYKGLGGRPAHFKTAQELVKSYHPFYYSGRTENPKDLCLVGYSNPFDLTRKFGTSWMDSMEPQWEIYYTYIDDTIPFSYLDDGLGKTHLYPTINALKQHWIRVNGEEKRGYVSIDDLPFKAKALWYAFWEEHNPQHPLPRGRAKKIQEEFFLLTGITPIDLAENADDFEDFLASGYRLEDILTF